MGRGATMNTHTCGVSAHIGSWMSAGAIERIPWGQPDGASPGQRIASVRGWRMRCKSERGAVMSSRFAIPDVNTLAARWWVPLVRGVAAILFGVLAIAAPEISLLVFGALLVGLSVRLHDWGRSHERPIPTGGAPTPA
jgi:hypothetical protein